MTELWRRAAAVLLLTAVSSLAASATEPKRHVCVPGSDGSWNCGDAAQPPQPAALPERSSARPAPVPPVLLMDPARFRVNESSPAAATADTSATVSSSGPAAVASIAPPPTATTTRPAAPAVAPSNAVAAPVVTSTAALRQFSSVSRTGYTLQLAAASSPNGFVPRLRELGIRTDQAFAVPVQRGSTTLWLLCVGEYPDTAAARAAAPAAAGGAFPKALAQLHAEHSGAR